MRAGHSRGFTLIEVLVALALVASVLGGTLMVLRQSIATQQYLEQRLLARWVADNVVNQFVLEHDAFVATGEAGAQRMLGRRYTYNLSVAPVVSPAHEPKTVNAGFDIVVEVHAGRARGAPLARTIRRVSAGAGV